MKTKLRVKRFLCRRLGHNWMPWEDDETPYGLVSYRACQRCPAYETRGPAGIVRW